ncbi:alpha-galactosidase [Mucilaginibacter sp.]|uniref:alpha-galactosidase n=1 Tax=Mucilaginibacter sp. TaxID=1882438 RepID=UPI002840B9D7|nr:alpha-galactosidase [Mucilaginibacter sp.]MDR3695263.1 alpha-galactosidase [Mucilaginibacter sp.]
MKLKTIGLICMFTAFFCLWATAQPLPVWNNSTQKTNTGDWLTSKPAVKAQVFANNNGREIILYNGLLKRVFRISPNVACIDYENLSNGRQLLRSVKAEARLTINGKNYNIGGLYGQKENAYILPSGLDKLTDGSHDFEFVDYAVTSIQPYLNWKTRFWIPVVPKASGKMISFRYKANAPELAGMEVKVNYELYDGIPLIEKSLSIENKGGKVFKINRVVNEILGMVEEESAVVGKPEDMKKNQGIYFETNYAFNNAMRYALSDQVTHWKVDTAYTSQVNYDLQTPCLLEIYPEQGPGVELQPGGTFNSVRTNELLMDSYDKERRGLMVRKMYRVIAPWTTANPIFMHLVSKNDEDVRHAVDQCAATGYEAVILSFGSHLNMEDTSAANLKRWKELADYAHSRHIFIGGYDLFSSRRISDADDVIDPKTGKPGGALFGNAPCFGSKWGLAFRDKIKTFFTQTDFDIWENDGPYPGDLCASTTHPGHKGLDDSQWQQMEIQKELYHWLNARGIYINAPDWYFLDGTNKIAIGYREVNFSLPREDQKILNRQNIYDGTWEKTPSMGWGFVPLTRYQGGGPEAVLEPLSEHLDDYKALMMEYYGSGVQACYRGPRLYDTEQTKQTVIGVISWYKKYREILNSDIIHLRRADGRDWDGILHVNPQLKIKGLVMLYNPTDKAITRHIQLPLYYTGLTQTARISEQGKAPKVYHLNRDYSVNLDCTMPANGYTWLTVE